MNHFVEVVKLSSAGKYSTYVAVSASSSQRRCSIFILHGGP
jgi:hypothetical protein